MSRGSVDTSLHTFRSPEIEHVLDEAVRFMIQTPVHELPPSDSFPGVGVYALYYIGDFKLYRPIARTNDRTNPVRPLYIGKAVPEGWRAARNTASTDAPALYRRLCEHARSIAQSCNLRVADFLCRFVILRDAEADLLTALEARLIREQSPLWNTVLDGFGNHDPGSGRYDQAPSEWDVLHPGRPWAKRLRGKPPDHNAVVAKVRDALQ